MITAKKAELQSKMVRAGYTGKSLAKASGITQGYMSFIMRGKRQILPPTAKKICDALECEFDDVFMEVIADNE